VSWASFQALLFHASGKEDLVVGTDVANRPAVETEQMIGFFVNQIVLRADLAGDPAFLELLKRTRRTALAGFAHQDLPFDRLVSSLQLDRDLNQTPLFQVKFVLQNVPPQADDLAELELRPLDLEWGSAKFDLLLNLTEVDGAITGSMEYSTDLFNVTTVQKLCADYGRLLEIAAAEPSIPVSELRRRLTSLEERDRTADRSQREKKSLDLLQKIKTRSGAAVRPAVQRRPRTANADATEDRENEA
jgi:non-ribosomal peptide synthetase component F